MEKRIYLSPPHMGGLERDYVSEAFATNWISPLGPNVDAFEQELADYVGAGGAVALSSGTAGIHMALRLLGVGPGDTVFCSTFTFVASASPILYQGASPVFIDSEPASWNMSPEALERALRDAHASRKLPKAVVIVNLYGQSADMEPLLALCDHYGVPVVEDAAESLGATYRGKASGTFGRFGVYSFNGNKIITTSGGGMIVSDDADALRRAKYLATQAREAAMHYQHSEAGYNYRMSNVLAGIGRGQLRVLEQRVAARRTVFDRYCEQLGCLDGVSFMPEPAYGSANRWLTAMTIDPDAAGVSPVRIVEALDARNIEARLLWKPLHLQPLFRDCPYYAHRERESVSESLFRQGVCLPSGSGLTVEEQFRVIECVRQCLEKVDVAS